MTPDETAQVLAYCAAVDTRFATVSPDEAQARIVAWTDVLDQVPAEFVWERVRRYYRQAVEWPVKPGEIRSAWITRRDRERAATRPVSSRTATEDRADEIRAALAAARASCRRDSAVLGYGS